MHNPQETVLPLTVGQVDCAFILCWFEKQRKRTVNMSFYLHKKTGVGLPKYANHSILKYSLGVGLLLNPFLGGDGHWMLNGCVCGRSKTAAYG